MVRRRACSKSHSQPALMMATSVMTPGPAVGASPAGIDEDVQAALNSLYRRTPAARTLGERAKGIRVFPNIALRGEMTIPSRIFRFAVWVRAAVVVTAIAVAGRGAHAQELEPRAYVNTPVGLNFLLAGYGYTEGSVVFSAASPIKDAEVQTHAGVLAYVRSLDVWGLSGKFGLVVPFADASGTAKLAGQPRERQVFGRADPTFRLSVNLYGAPALSLEEFKDYRQDLIIGATLNVSPPLGQYNSTKLLNIGTNRWSVKPELGASKALGPFTLEMSAAVAFFTSNADFLGGKTLEQDPLYSVQSHLVYEIRAGIWAALDATYYCALRN